MGIVLRLLTAVSLLLAGAASGRCADPALVEGRQRSDEFLRGDLAIVWSAMTAEMRDTLGSLEALQRFRTELMRTYGTETDILHENVQRDGEIEVYMRTARWTEADVPLVMQWAFDGSNSIAGFFVRPAPRPAETRFGNYRTKASLRLPFSGVWYVFWGGRTVESNYHVVDRAQRFAADFLIRRRGSSHRGDAADPSNYLCWGRPILAPAAGTVVEVVEGLTDQPIGERDLANPAGNHVVLDLGHSEFAVLAHLQRNSVPVEVGERVAPGEMVGRCGNSGNSSEPHLHFHLQTTPQLGTGEGLPAFFRDYRADGEQVESGEPQRGQYVAPL